jgi:hypothetical protein
MMGQGCTGVRLLKEGCWPHRCDSNFGCALLGCLEWGSGWWVDFEGGGCDEGFCWSLQLVRGGGGLGFTLALCLSALLACPLGNRASVSLLGLMRAKLMSALLASPF